MDSAEFIQVLRKNLPKSYPDWLESSSGASNESLAATEKIVGLEIPIELKRFLSVCNGLGSDISLRDGLYLLSCEQIAEFWKMHVDVLQWTPENLSTERS